MSEPSQVRSAKGRNEILNELILRLLLQSHAQQFELLRGLALTSIVDEAEIACKADVEVLNGELVKPAVVQTLHSQRHDGLDLMAFREQGRDELSGKILVQQDFHAGCNSF